MTACDSLCSVFKTNENHSALVYNGTIRTYSDLIREALTRVHYWRAKGLSQNSRILLKSINRLEFLISILAGAIGGYELVLVNQKATNDELDYIRSVTNPELEWNDPPSDLHQYDNDYEIIFHNINIIFFTSGTTSLPKGVCHTLESMLANADAFNIRAGVDKAIRMYHVMPTGYMAGLLNTFMSPIMAGGTVILGDVFDVRSALSFWEMARENDINTIWLTPTMVATLAALCRDEDIPKWTSSNLKSVFVGTAPLHASTRQTFLKRFGVDCNESYGLTECMFISVNPINSPNPNNTVGLLLPGVDCEVRGEFGNVLKPGEEGDIWVRSSYTLKGYLDTESGKPVSAIDEGGWLDTGDIGTIGQDSRITIMGRRKDIIIHGGTNVSPKAVEDVMLSLSGVNDVAVIGVPHPHWGEEVVAYIIQNTDIKVNVDDLRSLCSNKLNSDAVPNKIHFVKEFPRSGTGKVQKHLLPRY